MLAPTPDALLLLSVAGGRLAIRARGFRHRARHERDVPRRVRARIDASWTLACSLSTIDLLRGAEYQTRHLLLALGAGEPRRLLRALTLEVSYAAMPGAGSEKRTERLLTLASRLAGEHQDATADGLLCLTKGIAAYLHARNEQALSHCEEALSIFTRRCTGAVWETVTAHRFSIASAFFLGRFEWLSEKVPPLSAEAEDSGNVYAAMCFRAAYSTVAWLSPDRADEAHRLLARTRQQWRAKTFQLSHYNIVVGETLHDLYVGNAVGALERLTREWKAIEQAMMMSVAILRVQLFHFRAAAAAAAAEIHESRGDRSTARALRAEARFYASKFRQDPILRARPLAALVEAQVDLAEGKTERAVSNLRKAELAFDEQGLSLYAAATRITLGGALGGGTGSALVASGTAAFSREGVKDVPRMVAALGTGIA
jgi:hypothetical protein